jgi:hypothetical protein
MASVRRHLASLGLAVVVCQFVLQILVTAALCCERPATTAARLQDCCPAGSHAGKICPMHGARRAGSNRASDDECHARPRNEVPNLFTLLTGSGILPSPVMLAVPEGIEQAPSPAQTTPPLHIDIPLGPPPRA